eukprot:scaffold102108_cov28-Prasinocladus_malaysianus.AAC.1
MTQQAANINPSAAGRLGNSGIANAQPARDGSIADPLRAVAPLNNSDGLNSQPSDSHAASTSKPKHIADFSNIPKTRDSSLPHTSVMSDDLREDSLHQSGDEHRLQNSLPMQVPEPPGEFTRLHNPKNADAEGEDEHLRAFRGC